ncbi:Bifunctional glutamine synthetase adenylyltransferase/adenylyl-removing enzyme, partial [Clarias magur]
RREREKRTSISNYVFILFAWDEQGETDRLQYRRWCLKWKDPTSFKLLDGSFLWKLLMSVRKR